MILYFSLYKEHHKQKCFLIGNKFKDELEALFDHENNYNIEVCLKKSDRVSNQLRLRSRLHLEYSCSYMCNRAYISMLMVAWLLSVAHGGLKIATYCAMAIYFVFTNNTRLYDTEKLYFLMFICCKVFRLLLIMLSRIIFLLF